MKQIKFRNIHGFINSIAMASNDNSTDDETKVLRGSKKTAFKN